MTVPLNPQLPGAWKIPGIYFSFDLNGLTAGSGDLSKRALLMGYMSATGTAQPSVGVRVNGQDDANQLFGRGSDLAREVAAFLSEIGGGVADLWCCGLLEPSGGATASHLVNFGGSPTAPGSVDVILCGVITSLPVALNDTPVTLGIAASAALNKLLDSPIGTVTDDGAGNVTIPYRHKGETGNDFPVIVNNNAPGITVSPGSIAYGAGPAVGAGSALVKVSSQSFNAAIANGDSGTTIAANLATAAAAGAFPVTATANAGTLTLFYVNGRVVHRIAASIITSTGVTVTQSTGTSVPETNVNRPGLTGALNSLSAQAGGFSVWVNPFTDTTSLGTIATSLETQGNGLNQKNQFLHFGSTDSLSVAGAITPNVTPNLTTPPSSGTSGVGYSEAWVPDAAVQAHEIAARCAALMVAQDYAPHNYDGDVIHSDGAGKVPLPLPARAVRPPPPDVNAAIATYGMTPLVVDETANTLVIVRGTSTYIGSDELSSWGFLRHLQFLRASFTQKLSVLFKGKNLRLNGTPKSPNCITPDSVKDAIFVHMKELDGLDLYDGADQFKAAVQVAPNPLRKSRIDCFVPLAAIRGLDQLGLVGAPA
jgi:phage tail sheath gpL-like